MPVRVLRRDGTSFDVHATAAVETTFEWALLRAGGVIPSILARFLPPAATGTAAAADVAREPGQ